MKKRNMTLKIYIPYTVLLWALMIATGIFITTTEIDAYQTPTPIPQNASLEEWITILTPSTQCALPCWWNIIPGETTLDESESIILSKFESVETDRLVINANQENMAATQFTMRLENTPSATSGGVMNIYFDATNGIVENVTLISMEDAMVGSSETILAWEAFSIRNTLQTYGTPDVVQTYLEQTSDGLRGNSLWLYWEDYGLAIQYDEKSVVTSVGIPNAPICYNLENLLYLQVWLQEPNNINSLLATTSTFNLGVKNLSEISDISNQEFRQILLDNNGCLPTNLPVDWNRTTCNYSPTNLADLRTAITNTNNDNDISNICLTANATYAISSPSSGLNGLPVITKNIKIIGNGATLTRQSGSPNFRLFEVAAAGALTLENLTLSGGKLPNEPGGAITNYGTLTLNTVTLTGNQALTGGAVDNQDGTLTIVDSTFQNNQATFGGAIDNDAGNMLSITGATFTSNTAQNDGGAIHNDGGTLTVTDSTFTSNTATRYGGELDNLGQATLSSSTALMHNS